MPAILLLLPVSLAGCSAPAPSLHIHKTATCMCCSEWEDELRDAGFDVVVEEAYNVAPLMRNMGVPAEFQSCSTASIDTLFLQGEVPPDDIRRLLAERPDAAGLAVRGSVPLTGAGGDEEPGDVLLVDRSGRLSVFAHHHR